MVSPEGFRLGFTYDDALLRPHYTDFVRDDVNTRTKLTNSIELGNPFVSSCMDTVTGPKLAAALARLGGIGIIHRNYLIKKHAQAVAKVKSQGLLVGAAIAATDDDARLESLVEAGADVIVIDNAHGFSKPVVEALRRTKKLFPKTQVIAGNVATDEGAEMLCDNGADALRVGMGPGAICSTRVITGMGVPQLTAIMETVEVANRKGVPVIADGGIQHSGDVVKAIAAGASTIMIGEKFAGCKESPGKIIKLHHSQVPNRFQDILKSGQDYYKFKPYRGMGSEGAIKQGAKVRSEGEFHGNSFNSRIIVAEGVEGYVPLSGTVQELMDQMMGGLRSGMFNVGTRDIESLRALSQDKSNFYLITQASLTESHPHDILITNPGKNY